MSGTTAKEKYEAGKRFNLSDVVLDIDGGIIRIGEFYRTKNGTSSKTFSADFLKAFCGANGLKAASATRDAYMESIISAKQKDTPIRNAVFPNLIIEDDIGNREHDVTTARSSDASNLSEIASELGGLRLGGGIDKKRDSIIDKVRVNLEMTSMNYKKTELVIELTRQIEKTYEKLESFDKVLVHVPEDEEEKKTYYEEKKKEYLVMLKYFWNERNNLMHPNNEEE